jgi:hypothetical protein
MGLFKRDPSGRLPSDIVRRMERFGRHEIDPRASREDPVDLFEITQTPLVSLAATDPAGFIRELADACVPTGGFATFGADRTVINLVGVAPPGDDWFRILDSSLAFLWANFVPPMRVARYAWDRFLAMGGTGNTWLELRQPPARETAAITPLAEGEVRALIKVAPEPEANVILVRRDGDTYVGVIESAWSDEDPTRSRDDWPGKRSDDLYGLFVDLAWSTQSWDWAHPELEHFFPAPRALI